MVGRPTTPLITRERAASVALEIIDDDGLEAFNLPALARRMGISAPSLYWHFADKNEILRAVAQLIVDSTVEPRKPDPDAWPEWFVQYSLNLRKAILRHRNAAPILIQFLPRDGLVQLFDAASEYLDEMGVPIELHVQLLDGIETLSVGAALTEAMRPRSRRNPIFPELNRELQPRLARAIDANDMNAATLHAAAVRNFIHGTMAAKLGPGSGAQKRRGDR